MTFVPAPYPIWAVMDYHFLSPTEPCTFLAEPYLLVGWEDNEPRLLETDGTIGGFDTDQHGARFFLAFYVDRDEANERYAWVAKRLSSRSN